MARLSDWWSKGAENDAAWRALSLKDKFYYEVGQKTMSNAEFSRYAAYDAVSRGHKLMAEHGWKALFSSYEHLSATWATGPTPALRYLGPRAAVGLGVGATGVGGWYVWGDE